MVFVRSYLTDGDPAYTLIQVAVNDLIMLVAFAPIVMFLCGVAHVIVPAKVLITSVVVFIVVPLTFACWWKCRSCFPFATFAIGQVTCIMEKHKLRIEL